LRYIVLVPKYTSIDKLSPEILATSRFALESVGFSWENDNGVFHVSTQELWDQALTAAKGMCDSTRDSWIVYNNKVVAVHRMIIERIF